AFGLLQPRLRNDFYRGVFRSAFLRLLWLSIDIQEGTNGQHRECASQPSSIQYALHKTMLFTPAWAPDCYLLQTVKVTRCALSFMISGSGQLTVAWVEQAVLGLH